VNVQLNGAPREIDDGTTLASLMARLVGSTRGSAAVVDGEVVPRGRWASFELQDGQTVELLTAVQGG
jgi:sulfur carrier protein